MTNNPTIDGVSRELLRRQFEEKNEHRGWFVVGGSYESDTPEGFVYGDFTTDKCWTCYFEANAALQSTIAQLQARIAELESERGEVIHQVRTHGSDVWEDIPGESLEMCQCQPEEYEIRRLYATTPAPVALSFSFEHPTSKEKRTVTLTKRDVFDGMEDYFYDKLVEQICHCESVGETNVVDCNCDEYVHDFEIVGACLDATAAPNEVKHE